MSDKVWLNLGCGNVLLPGPKPAHHALLDDSLYAADRQWLNVDSVDMQVPNFRRINLFRYPWAMPSDAFGGALLGHLCEHIPHTIRPARGIVAKNYERFESLADGWFAFFNELHRVLADGAEAHILCPHRDSNGAWHDPTHTRFLVPETFMHSLVTRNTDAPFEYAGVKRWKLDSGEVRIGVDADNEPIEFALVLRKCSG